MIINTTFVVGSDISEKWQKWLKTVFATSASEAGMDGLLVMKVLDAQSEAENSNTYAVQLRGCDNDALHWQQSVLPALLRKMYVIWGEKAVSFTTIMQELEL